MKQGLSIELAIYLRLTHISRLRSTMTCYYDYCYYYYYYDYYYYYYYHYFNALLLMPPTQRLIS